MFGWLVWDKTLPPTQPTKARARKRAFSVTDGDVLVLVLEAF